MIRSTVQVLEGSTGAFIAGWDGGYVPRRDEVVEVDDQKRLVLGVVYMLDRVLELVTARVYVSAPTSFEPRRAPAAPEPEQASLPLGKKKAKEGA